jgi:hypothetical protein
MSKLHKGKTCAYCGRLGASQTGDHVLARALVAEALRGEIPIVPACAACNGKKSELEHYAAVVLPFGGRHAGASARLSGDVPKRLAKNQRLHRELASGQTQVWSVERGLILPCLAIPIEGERIEQLVGYIVRGLMFHHWSVVLGNDCMVNVLSLTRHGEGFFGHYLGLNANQRALGNIGRGALQYHGAQGVDNPQVSFWVVSLYGGMKTEGDDRTTSTKFGVMTGPLAARERIDRAAANGLLLLS